MTIKRWNTKRDGNEAVIVEALRKAGLHVVLLDAPWDLICSYGSLSRFAEVKMPRNKANDPKPYTETQLKTLESWPGGAVDTLVTVEQAMAFADRLKSDARAVAVAS